MAPVRFQVVFTRKQVAHAPEGSVLLERRGWDDHGTRCTFRVLIARGDSYEQLGDWKIVDSREPLAPEPDLPASFTALPAAFVSLGQDLDAYRRVATLPAPLARAVLDGLRDLVYRPRPDVRRAPWLARNLARFASARTALEGGGALLTGAGLARARRDTARSRAASGPGSLDLRVRAQLRGFPSRHDLTLAFSRDPRAAGLRRMVALVGANGAGKTQLLAALARSLSGLESAVAEVVPDKPFSQVVAVSYGAFDHFLVPKLSGAPISYVYCGLRTPAGDDHRITLDLERAIGRGAEEVAQLAHDAERGEVWRGALSRVGLEELAGMLPRGADAVARYLREHLSAGQKLVALTIGNLVTALQPGSIVLHDEPETHLHPNLLSGLLRAIHFLLERFDSYAVVATHSLVPVQELPSSNVVILDRDEEGGVHASRPPEQCFASTLDEISRMVFRAGSRDQNYRTRLAELRERHEVDEVQRILGGELSLGARLLLAAEEP